MKNALVVVAAAAWLLVNPDQFRPRFEAMLGGAFGRKVSLGHIRLALFSGSLAIDDVAFRVEGTTSDPRFVRPDVRRTVKSALNREAAKRKAAEMLGGLFRRKK